MITTPILLYVLAVLFVATIFRSGFGFGEALVAVPLLAFRLPVATAAPLAVAVSITVAAIVVSQDWRHIHVRSAGGLLLATLLGLPVGLLLLARANEHAIKILLALFLISFSTWLLTSGKKLRLDQDHRGWLFSCGFAAGLLGGAFGMNGPPLVIYGALRRWSPQHFRATLQGYFLPASICGLVGFILTGLWTPMLTRLYLLSLPLVIVATLIGRAINRRLSGHSFLTYLYLALLANGLLLLLRTCFS